MSLCTQKQPEAAVIYLVILLYVCSCSHCLTVHHIGAVVWSVTNAAVQNWSLWAFLDCPLAMTHWCALPCKPLYQNMYLVRLAVIDTRPKRCVNRQLDLHMHSAVCDHWTCSAVNLLTSCCVWQIAYNCNWQQYFAAAQVMQHQHPH